MKNLLSVWINKFLKEDLSLQVHTIERVAVYGFILFLLVLFYIANLNIDLTVPDKTGRKVVAQKTLFALFMDKK